MYATQYVQCTVYQHRKDQSLCLICGDDDVLPWVSYRHYPCHSFNLNRLAKLPCFGVGVMSSRSSLSLNNSILTRVAGNGAVLSASSIIVGCTGSGSRSGDVFDMEEERLVNCKSFE
eukprot:230612_1